MYWTEYGMYETNQEDVRDKVWDVYKMPAGMGCTELVMGCKRKRIEFKMPGKVARDQIWDVPDKVWDEKCRERDVRDQVWHVRCQVRNVRCQIGDLRDKLPLFVHSVLVQTIERSVYYPSTSTQKPVVSFLSRTWLQLPGTKSLRPGETRYVMYDMLVLPAMKMCTAKAR